ncbi:MAG: hypothetical protein HZA52_06555 [Planctomycetes bacterium]|nr:hypothetical protein [Planctomycetota bacterium]
MHASLRSSLALFTLAVLSSGAFAGVTVLGKPGLGTFTTLQGAIDAASEHDVLLATAGSYAPFTIDGKGLTVLGQGLVTVNGSCTVKNLAKASDVGLVHLRILGPTQSFVGGAPPFGLELLHCEGDLRIQDCTLVGGRVVAWFTSAPAGPAASVVDCKRVMVTRSTLTGGSAGFLPGELPAAGGEGLNANASSIALYDCTVRGGDGSHETSPSGGEGGVGARIDGWGVFSSGSQIAGGTGGGGDYIGCTVSGDGGDGVVITGAQLKLLDSPVSGGFAGNFGPCGLGVAGQPFDATNAVVSTLVGVARELSASNQVSDGSILSLTFRGAPGDKVWLVVAGEPAFGLVPSYVGIAGVPWPSFLSLQPLGTIAGDGTLAGNLPIGVYSGPAAGWTLHLQGVCVNAAQRRVFTTPAQVLVENL